MTPDLDVAAGDAGGELAGAAGSVGTWTVTRPALAGTLASTL
jgi:hypothetical protein